MPCGQLGGGAYYGTRGPSRKAITGNSWVLPGQPRGGPGGAPAAWPSVRWGVWARSASRAVLSRGGRAAPSILPPRATPSAPSIRLLEIGCLYKEITQKEDQRLLTPCQKS